MAIKGKVHRNKNLVRKYSVAADALEDEQKRALTFLGFKIQELAVKSIQTSTGGGRVYTNEFRTIDGRAVPMGNLPRTPHRASKAGDPPNTDTGTLVRNIFVQLRGKKIFTVAVGLLGRNEPLRYGRWLEFGTKNMAARPWLSPAFRAATKRATTTLTNRYKKRLEKELKKTKTRPPGAPKK